MSSFGVVAGIYLHLCSTARFNGADARAASAIFRTLHVRVCLLQLDSNSVGRFVVCSWDANCYIWQAHAPGSLASSLASCKASSVVAQLSEVPLLRLERNAGNELRALLFMRQVRAACRAAAIPCRPDPRFGSPTAKSDIAFKLSAVVVVDNSSELPEMAPGPSFCWQAA